jgi:hypothetical protein
LIRFLATAIRFWISDTRPAGAPTSLGLSALGALVSEIGSREAHPRERPLLPDAALGSFVLSRLALAGQLSLQVQARPCNPHDGEA